MKNDLLKKSVLKSAVSIIVVVMLFFQTVTPVYAFTGDTITNDTARNLTILEKLKSLYGDNLTEAHLENELANMGLLDEDGQISVSESVNIDGQMMTLEQIEKMIEDEGDDLNRIVDVDGIRLPLGDLKKIIEIENELVRIREAYFSDPVMLTDEHQESLASLLSQMETEGIELQSDFEPQNTEPSINHQARIKIAHVNSEYTMGSDTQNIFMEFWLVDENGDPTTLDYDIQFDWRLTDGTAIKDFHYKAWTGYVPEGTVTIHKGSSVIYAPLKISKIINYIHSSQDMTNTYKNPLNRWQGDKTFFVQLFNPVNVLFEGDTRTKDIEVTLKNNYQWRVAMTESLAFRSIPVSGGIPYFEYAFIYDTLKDAVSDIFGSVSEAGFEVNMSGKLFAVYDTPKTMTATPQYLDESGAVIGTDQFWDGGIGAWYRIPYESEYNIYSSEATEAEDSFYYTRFFGALPKYFKYSGASFSPSPYTETRMNYKDRVIDLSIFDIKPPMVENISVPAGDYFSGQVVPIQVEFSEPVRMADLEMSLQGESVAITPAESDTTVSKYATFLYIVPKSPNTSLVISEIRDIKGLVDTQLSSISVNVTEQWPSDGHLTTIPDVQMLSDPLLAIEEISLGNVPEDGKYNPDDTIEVIVDVDTEVSQWLENDYNLIQNHLETVYIKAGDRTYPLVMGGEGIEQGSFYIAKIPAINHVNQNDQNMMIELYTEGTCIAATDDTPMFFAEGKAVIGQSVTVALEALVLATEVILNTDTYPINDIIYLTDEEYIQLEAILSPENSNFKHVKWQSQNPDIALIHETTGIVTPVRQGAVCFRAIADNGGIGTPVYADTPQFNVVAGGPPTIIFPEGNHAFVTYKNESVDIVWSQNIIGRTPDTSTVFSLVIYEEDTPIYSTLVTDESHFSVPINVLSKISVGSDPAYTVQVSAPNPDDTIQILSATGYIIVYPKPVGVKIYDLDRYVITDEMNNLNIGWEFTDFVGGTSEIRIDKNQETIYSGSADSGSHVLAIDDVDDNRLKDLYTVRVKAKNTQDEAWTADSFVLNVYRQDVLEINVDGVGMASLTMDNNERIRSIYEHMGSAGILALNREISLSHDLAINHGDFEWESVTDRIKWQSEDSLTASVNYRQGTLFENIELFDYETYRPSTQFMLAGNDDGITSIRATHAATGMEDVLEVQVKTLKDRLYLFNFYPKQPTELTYYNGNGESRTLYSDSNGEIAVYEESGIVSDISLKSGDSGGIYLGTLYHEDLVSGEKNPGIYERYPINLFQLRQAAKVELFFKDKTGNPFTGQVTYRGAVYKNGEICPETIESQGHMMMIGDDGRFTIELDASKFWIENHTETLKASDQLMFIYEVVTADDNYYPRLIHVNGKLSVADVVHFGESVINLKSVNEDERYKPYVESQVINYNLRDGRTLDVSQYQGSVGPSDMYPSANLETMVAWWGYDKRDGYDVKIEDEFGGLIEGQRVKTILYPFATMAYTQNVTTLSESSLNLEVGEKKGGVVFFYNTSGELLKNIGCPFNLTNMVGAPEIGTDVKEAAQKMDDLAEIEFNIEDSMSGGNKIVSEALKGMADSDISYGDFSLYINIKATEDPMVYRGIITKKLGVNADTDDVTVDIDGPDTSYFYGYDPDKMADIGFEAVMMLTELPLPMSAGIDFGVKLAGYFDVEIKYDLEQGKWVIVLMGGGLDLDALFGASASINAAVGPIPVTADVSIGGAEKFMFRAIKPYGQVSDDINAADVNDFFTSLRLKAYLTMFGGVGFDYSLVALKIGAFGKANLDFSAEFINKPYMIEGDGLYAYLETLGIYGQVGVKFVATLGHISYETVLASVEGGTDFWVEGQQYRSRLEEWKSQQTSALLASSGMYQASILSAVSGLKKVKETTSYESRDYLKRYEREWTVSSLMSMLKASSEIKNIQTNAYPYANPVVTRDGAIMGYMSDSDVENLNETRASWAIMQGSEYVNQGALPEVSGDSRANSRMALDGTSEFAVAAWEHQRLCIDSESTPTAEDVAAMINSTDIVASVYNGIDWTTVRLTDNLVSDVSPVVAANNGKALVIWRSLAGTDVESLLEAELHDAILYSTFEDGIWSEAQYLYNGNAGCVRGFSAAMMPDGTAGVAYTVDYGTETNDPTYGYETVFAVIGDDNRVLTDVRLTHNDYVDQNPQIKVVDFETEDYRFVVGWHQTTDQGTTDIKLAAMDREGKPDSDFIESVSQVYDYSQVNIRSHFRLVGKDLAGIEDLSIVWVQPNINYEDDDGYTAQSDSLKAIKFMRDEQENIYLTTALDVADMPNHTLIDHFDGFVGLENQLTTVMLTSSYTGELEYQGHDVYTVDSVSDMKMVRTSYKNKIGIEETHFDFENIRSGFRLPMTFTVINRGVDVITGIDVSLEPDHALKSFNSLNLMPNQAIVLTVDYDVPESDIHDLEYEITASFKNGDSDSESGTLDLDIPDTGISKVELTSDQQGERVFQVTLRNSGDVKLAGSDRRVYAGFYTSSLFNDESIVEVREITGDDLMLMDKGALTGRYTYTLGSEGIPHGGLRLYARVWVEEKIDDEWIEIRENYPNDNARSILLPNPIEANNGNPFLIKVEQENNQVTKVNVTVKNLSMTPSSNGNVLVNLLDETGKVIETKFVATDSSDLIALRGEESITREVVFSVTGKRVIAEYFTEKPEMTIQEIAAIKLSGINLNFDQELYDYHVMTYNMNDTLMTVIAQNSEDVVEIRSANGDVLLANGRGSVVYPWKLTQGQRSKVQVVISGNATDVYSIAVTSVQKSSGSVILDVPNTNVRNARISVSAVGMTDFIPVKWQYVKNGEWSDVMDWIAEGPNSFVISDIGTYRVAARVFDANGYSIDSNAMSVVVNETEIGQAIDHKTYYAEIFGPWMLNLPITFYNNVARLNLDALSEEMWHCEPVTVIDIPTIHGAEDYVIEMPVDALSQFGEKGYLTFGTKMGSLTLSTDMLTVYTESLGNQAEITIGQGDLAYLSDAVKEAIGDRPVLQLSLRIDGKPVEWLNSQAPVRVSIPYTPSDEELNHPESIVIWYIDSMGNLISVPNGSYDSLTGKVSFTTTHFSYYAIGYHPVDFEDVTVNAWYKKAIDFVAAREITKGTGNSHFSPDAKLTRGDYMVMLMKAYQLSPDINPTDNFVDAGNTYYTGYLAVAKRLGITQGVGQNMFAPTREITRQEMFTLLYNSLKVINQMPEDHGDKLLSDFTDSTEIAPWAREAMTLFVSTGTIKGNAGKLTPSYTTTRAEMAQVLYNLLVK